MKNQDNYFFSDGEWLNEEKTRKKFTSFSLGERQKKCIDLLPEKSVSILDLGCYSGLFTAELCKKFPEKKVVGGDYDQNNLKIAKFIYSEYADHFEEINVYRIHYSDEFFDCVVFQDVIEHLEGAAIGVKEINRVLKIGGTFIITTPSPYYYKEMLNFTKYEILRKFKRNLPLSSVVFFENIEWNRHIYCWTPSTLLTLLKVNGFEYVTHTYCQDSQSYFGRILLKFFPFLSPTMILKVKKISNAPYKVV